MFEQEARTQAKARSQPDTPKKAHSRALQAAVKQMQDKLYAKKTIRKVRCSATHTSRSSSSAIIPRASLSCTPPHLPLRHHPP